MGSTEFHQRNRRGNHGRHSHSQKLNAVTYTNDPYSSLAPVAIERTARVSFETQNREVAKKLLPKGTLRLDLYGKVAFIPFPEHVIDRTRTRTEAPPLEQRPASLVQMFFGQLPYKVSDNMIVFLCEQLAESEVLYIERVMQDKSRKGCMQVFVDEQDADYISAALNKRVLFDATGVWQAQNDEQLVAMEAHCVNEFNRYKGFPFRPMVVERSTSTYVRRHRQPPTAATSSKRSTGSMTPPPEVNEDLSSEEYEACTCNCDTIPQYDGAVPEALITAEADCSSYYCTCGCMDAVYGSPQPNSYYASPAPYYSSYAEEQYNISYTDAPYSSFASVPPAYEHPPVYGGYVE